MFGFRKLIVATTSSGGLYALVSNTGSIAWSRRFEGSIRSVSVVRTVLTRVPPLIDVIVDTETTSVVTLNALTGEALHTKLLGFKAVSVLELSIVDANQRHILALIDSTSNTVCEKHVHFSQLRFTFIRQMAPWTTWIRSCIISHKVLAAIASLAIRSASKM
jgi:outer membrane protein assembly factor BamB